MIPLRDDQQPRRVPVVTWALLLVNAAVFVYELALSPWAAERFQLLHGMIPARFLVPGWAEYHGFPDAGLLTFVSSMFMHGGWLHILMNMWTLWLFGDDVEDRLGSARFFGLYLFAGVSATAVHAALHPLSEAPVIGASGAVAGVMGAFLLLFPRARLDVLVPILFLPLVWRIPAALYLPVWFIGEFLSGTVALITPQFAGIAFWAHVGGFVAGVGGVLALGHLARSLEAWRMDAANAGRGVQWGWGFARDEVPVRRVRPDVVYGPDCPIPALRVAVPVHRFARHAERR